MPLEIVGDAGVLVRSVFDARSTEVPADARRALARSGAAAGRDAGRQAGVGFSRSAGPELDRGGREGGRRFFGGLSRQATDEGRTASRRFFGGFSVDSRGRGRATFGGIFGGAGAASAALGGLIGTGFGVSIAAENEQAQISFETMLGSAEKAQVFLADLQRFAAKTPFEFPELRDAASRLVAVGVNTRDVIPLMTTLGNVTAGMGTGAEGVQRASLALQQMATRGKATNEEFLQLQEAGVPAIQAVASHLGISTTKVQDLAREGKISFDTVRQAIQSGEGPLEKFGGLMDKQSATASGMFSTLKDTLGQGLASVISPHLGTITTGLEKVTKGAADFFAGLKGSGPLEGFSGVLNTAGLGLRALVLAFKDGDVTSDGFVGAMETVGVTLRSVAAFIGSDVLPRLAAVGAFLLRNEQIVVPVVAGLLAMYAAFKVITVAVRIFTAVQAALNVVLALNPISAVTLVLVGLATAFFVAYKRSETFRDIVQGVWRAVSGAAVAAWNGVIAPVFRGIGASLTGAANGFRAYRDFVIAAWGRIREAFRSAIADVVRRFFGFVGNILDGAARAFGWVPGIGPKLRAAAANFGRFRDDFNRAMGGLKDPKVDITVSVNKLAGSLINAGVSRAEALNIANRELKGRTHYGGPIRAGVRWKDSALILARRDEHVLTPEEVDAMGGHEAVSRWRAAARAGKLRHIPRFAAGGPVFSVRTGTGSTGRQMDYALGTVNAQLARAAALISDAASRGASNIAAQMLKAAAVAASATNNATGRSGWLFPLPRGTYRVGGGVGSYPGHTGRDYPAPAGTPVYAPVTMVITRSIDMSGSYGRHIFGSGAGYEFRFAHLLRRLVRSGQTVARGAKIGLVDSTGNSTGNHLHLEVRRGGAVLEPARFFAMGGVTDRPTLSVLSENYQRELTLPLTKPARTRELLAQEGLVGGPSVVVNNEFVGVLNPGVVAHRVAQDVARALRTGTVGTLLPGPA